MKGRVLPNNISAEREVIGSLLLTDSNSQSIPMALKVLTPAHFYRGQHGTIFEAIEAVFNSNRPVDLITVTEQLNKMGLDGKAVSAEDLYVMSDSIPTVANIQFHIDIVCEYALRRRLILTGANIYESGFDDSTDIQELTDSAETSVLKLRSGQFNGVVPLTELLSPTLDKLEAIYTREESTIGLPSGFADIDSLTSGFFPGDYIVIAGRPSMGKSAFVQTVMLTLGKKGIPSLLFSPEMSKESVVMRMLASASGVSLSALRTGKYPESEWGMLTVGASMLAKMPIVIDDTSGIPLSVLRAKAHQAISEYDVKIIFVDYLQLVKVKGMERRDEVEEVSGGLKALGRDLGVPLVALSQLNRQCESRPDKRPMLSDLRETGNIEQDADLVMMLYGASHYEKDANDSVEILIRKQRNGPTGMVELFFDKKCTTFRNLAKGDF